jgi:hypothetical protein
MAGLTIVLNNIVVDGNKINYDFSYSEELAKYLTKMNHFLSNMIYTNY